MLWQQHACAEARAAHWGMVVPGTHWREEGVEALAPSLRESLGKHRCPSGGSVPTAAPEWQPPAGPGLTGKGTGI